MKAVIMKLCRTGRFTCGPARVASSQDRLSGVQFMWKSCCLDRIYPLRNAVLIGLAKSSIGQWPKYLLIITNVFS